MRREHWVVLIAALAVGAVIEEIARGEAAALGLTTLELALLTVVVGKVGRRALR